MFYKKGVLRNFAKFTGKQLSQSLFFNKVAVLRPATSLKKRLWPRCFSVNFAKFFRTLFFTKAPPVATSEYELLQRQSDLNYKYETYSRIQNTVKHLR